jgi:hypothetical protein
MIEADTRDSVRTASRKATRQARARPHHHRQPEQPPRRLIAGADAIAIAEQKAKDLQEQANAFRDQPTSLAREDV